MLQGGGRGTGSTGNFSQNLIAKNFAQPEIIPSLIPPIFLSLPPCIGGGEEKIE